MIFVNCFIFIIDPSKGATVRQDPNGQIVIARLIKGGILDRNPSLIQPGDELVEIQDRDVRGMGLDEVCDWRKKLNGQITFVVNPV